MIESQQRALAILYTRRSWPSLELPSANLVSDTLAGSGELDVSRWLFNYTGDIHRNITTNIWSLANILNEPIQKDAGIEKYCKGQDASYATIILLTALKLTGERPFIAQAGNNGVSMSTFREEGTVTLVLSEGKAVLVHSTDDFLLQISYNLSAGNIHKLIGRYLNEILELIKE